MDLKLIELATGKESGNVSVSDELFNVEFNQSLVHQVVTAYMNAGRAGTKGQKNRAAVSGGGAKPWRQKGTGRARAGTTRSPVWVGGGRAFPGHNRDFSQKVNKKMYRGAMKSILSELVRQERLIVVDNFSVEAPKTKELVAKLKELELTDALIVTSEVDENLFLAARNLYKVDARDVAGIDPVSLIAFDKVVITADAVKQVEEMLA